MSHGYWMPKEASSPHDGDISYDNSPKIEAKRSHQWFMDGPEADLFPSKKQAIEGLNNNNSFLGMLTSSSSPWSTDAGVQTLSGHFDDQLFAAEASRTVNYEERSIPSMVSENFSLGRKVHENPFNDSSFALSMSCASEDIRSSLNYGGVRKVKVSEVKDRVPIVPPVTSGQTYNMMESSAIFTSPALGKADETPMSLSCPSTLGEENNIHPGTNDGRVDNFIMSMAQPNDTEDKNTSMGHSYDNGIWKDESSIIGISQSYRADDCSISMNHMYSRGNSDSVTMSNSYNMGCGNIGHSFGKGQSTIISFGGYDEDTNASGGLAYNYELLMAQHAAQTSNGMSEIDLVNPNSDAYENVSSQINLSGIDITSKKKEEQHGSKKASSNSFPSNVRSLLSTGVLDGILVKYIAWSKEELRAFIRGTGYLCGCQSCNYTKVINAYEFERHAGCKTKHPNNHIYFENGKTIYGIVQELRSTPQNMLFDVMQTITGSPINQKSFRLWKESYLAATRELQRIYGKEDGRQLS